MKKIGIVTHYHNSLNYGGNLQAYALCKYFTKQGVCAEQIDYILTARNYKKRGMIRIIRDAINSYIILLKRFARRVLYGKSIANVENIRKSAFYRFNRELIPHSSRVYNERNIKDCIEYYNIFVTGSDQVWNLNCYNSVFFLDFVPDTKKKISYAASVGSDRLDDEQKDIFINSLKTYKAISVREDKMVALLGKILDKNISLVLDPTLLLDIEDWEEVCDKRLIEDEYVFVYYLGYSHSSRNIVQEFAKKNKLKLVYIPYASGSWSRLEETIGDIQIMDASPEKFLSLIKYANYVFTDSFHAVVFSIIFRKQFFVFNRDENGSMNGRIVSLTNMFDLQERFCESKEQATIEYIEDMKDIDYDIDFMKFRECREKSFEFIRTNILE